MNKPIAMRLLISVILCCLMSGCWDAREMESQHYVSALGIDYQDGTYTAYIQLLSFSRLAKEEGGGEPKENPVWIGKATGKTINEAVTGIYESSQERIFWGHTSAFVLSRRLVEHGIGADLDLLRRYREFRYNSWVFGTEESIEDIFSAPNVLARNRRNNLLHEPKASYEQHSIIQPLSLREFMLNKQEPAKELLLPVLSTNSSVYSADQKPLTTLSIDGVYALDHGKWKGLLKKDELQGLQWMNPDMVRKPVFLMDGEEPVATLVIEGVKPKVHPEIKFGMPRFRVVIEAKGKVNERMKPVDQEELIRLASSMIGRQVRQTYEAGLKRKIDLLGVTEILYRKHPKVWHAMEEDGDDWLTDSMLVEIDVKLKLVSTGKYKLNTQAVR